MAEHERTISLSEAEVRLRPDGVLDVAFRLDAQLDLDAMRRVVAAGRQLLHAPVPTLLRLQRVRGMTREARKYLAHSPEAAAVASRLALEAPTPLARAIAGFLIQFNRPLMPTCAFPTAAEAEAWLQGQQPAEPEPEEDRHAEVLDVLAGLAAFDFSRRAGVGAAGDGLDALAAGANMASEELELALEQTDAHSRALEAATEAKSQFMANMSHEIRTPLTALMGFADLLADLDLSESDRLNYALIIRRNGEHLLSLINDILDLSKVEAGKLVLETIESELPALLADVQALMAGRAAEREIAFEVELATPVPAMIRTDPTRLRQVLLNLVGNAIKFTTVGGVKLRVALEGAQLRFDVVDTGIGLTPDQLERLFRPFEQADASMTRRFGGSGLGLAISKALAEALGGSVDVRSTPGRGSTFTLRLAGVVAAGAPLVTDLGGATAKLREAESPEAALVLEGRVLLVEDGPDNQVLVGTILRNRGLAVDLAENGQVAVDKAMAAWREGRPFDVILMDMQMPVLDGYAATMHLRDLGYRGPIVALTAHAMPGERERCFAAGCIDYLSKPVDRKALLTTVARFLAPAKVDAAPAPLLSTYAGDPEMEELVQHFVRGLPGRITELRTAAGRPEPDALMHLAHQLKGAAGGYGFAAISEAAGRLEQGLRDDDQRATGLVDELLTLCTRACSA